jgi:hypothetical protein
MNLKMEAGDSSRIQRTVLRRTSPTVKPVELCYA